MRRAAIDLAKAAERGTSDTRSNRLGGFILVCGFVCDQKLGETNTQTVTYVAERVQSELKDELETLVARRKVIEYTNWV